MNTALFSGSDLDVVFSLVLTMSLSASWIAAAVLVLRLCLKRAPKWVNVLLWGIVAARLVLPFSIESPLSLLPRTEAILPAVPAQPIQTGTAPAVGGAAAIASGAAMRSQPGWTTILAWVWLVGIAVLLLYTWISTQRLRRKVREAVRLRGNIYETEHIASPFVLGVLRPRIYLPYHMDSRDREQVIAHDDTVDDYFEQVKQALIHRIANDPAEGGTALDLLMIAKYLERIGDHATNIAEWVEFSVTGVHKEG